MSDQGKPLAGFAGFVVARVNGGSIRHALGPKREAALCGTQPGDCGKRGSGFGGSEKGHPCYWRIFVVSYDVTCKRCLRLLAKELETSVSKQTKRPRGEC